MADILVGKDHIDALLSIALKWGTEFDENMSWAAENPALTSSPSYREISGKGDPLFLDDVGTMLLLENARSLEYRYGSAPELEPYSFREVRALWIEKSARCFRPLDAYRYYSSEHPSWEKSEAFRFCQALEDSLILSLPEYGLGPWVYRRA